MSNLPLSKVCAKCGKDKPLAEFTRHKTCRLGRVNCCKECKRKNKPIPFSNLPGEEWRPIAGYEGVYSVSNQGRVRRDLEGVGALKGRVLKAGLVRGYPTVSLSKNGVVKKHVKVHILVAAAFLGPCPIGHEVNHEDGRKSNPDVGNLEYLTRGENIKHAYKHGLREYMKGEAVGNAKLTEDEVRAIRALEGTLSKAAIARRYRIGHTTVRGILSRRSCVSPRSSRNSLIRNRSIEINNTSIAIDESIWNPLILNSSMEAG